MAPLRTPIRPGKDAVAVLVDPELVLIEYGPDAIAATIYLDHGEARLLAETILADLAELHPQTELDNALKALRDLGMTEMAEALETLYDEVS